jgi:hypothetical protein
MRTHYNSGNLFGDYYMVRDLKNYLGTTASEDRVEQVIHYIESQESKERVREKIIKKIEEKRTKIQGS